MEPGDFARRDQARAATKLVDTGFVAEAGPLEKDAVPRSEAMEKMPQKPGDVVDETGLIGVDPEPVRGGLHDLDIHVEAHVTLFVIGLPPLRILPLFEPFAFGGCQVVEGEKREHEIAIGHQSSSLMVSSPPQWLQIQPSEVMTPQSRQRRNRTQGEDIMLS